ncbi:MAG: hypothetical protein GEU97_20250 [Actinophytocola sp.]|nr:hypothetical protein [Actinophytocola sp.]
MPRPVSEPSAVLGVSVSSRSPTVIVAGPGSVNVNDGALPDAWTSNGPLAGTSVFATSTGTWTSRVASGVSTAASASPLPSIVFAPTRLSPCVAVAGTIATDSTSNSGVGSPTTADPGTSALISTAIVCSPMSGNGQV